MTHHLSQHDLWGQGGNVVAVLPPSPGDLFVLVTVDGKIALNWPITEHERAVQVAQAFTRRLRGDSAITIKVLSVTLREAQAWGYAPRDLFAEQTPEEEAEWRQLARDACYDLLHYGTDPRVRADAMEMLRGMGLLQ